jgi:ABC-type spermidine/putrescine transport system permease subunit II
LVLFRILCAVNLTLPFEPLIMFAAFHPSIAREEAQRDHGASPWQYVWYVVLPIIVEGVIGTCLVSLYTVTSLLERH